MQARVEPQAVRDALAEVLARREFQDGRSMLEGRFGELFSGWAQELGQAVGPLLRVLPFFLFAALVLWLVRSARSTRQASAPSGALDAPSLAERVAAALRAARAARAAGDARAALRLYGFALVAGLGVRGELAFREAWTNRELLRRGRPASGARALLEELVRELEAKEYGREPVLAGDLERLDALCARWLGSARGGAA